MRIPRVVIPLLALAGVIFAAWRAYSAPQQAPSRPPVEPPRAPYPTTVGGAAILEPADERTLALSAPLAGLVTEVFVTTGARVKKGDPLFRIDERVLAAQRGVLASQVAVATARLDRLLALPRAEDIPPAEARVRFADAVVADRRAQLARLERAATAGRGVVPAEDVERARWAVDVAVKQTEAAQADLDRAKQGAWAPDVAESRAALAAAEALLEENERNRERHVVRAPSDGTVLELSVRAGEQATTNGDPLVRFGDLSKLRVRVDVDEESAPRVRAGARAQAVIRGFPERPVPLVFVRIEPWIRPKRSLTGSNTERVDTRVLQVIYDLGATDLPVYVGQQVDVFMDGVRREDLLGAAGGPVEDQPK